MKIHYRDDLDLNNIEYTKQYIWIIPLDSTGTLALDVVVLAKEEDNYQKLLFLAGVKRYNTWKYVENKWKKLGSYNLTQTKQQDT